MLGVWARKAGKEPLPADHLHSGPTLEQVRGLSSLVTLKAEIADVQVSGLHGYTGGVTAALLVKGDVLIATDLAQARFESVDQEGRKAVVVLPPPQVQTARVDHSRTKLVGLWRSGLWEIVPGDQAEQAVMNRVYAEAQGVVEAAGKDSTLDQRARAQAEAVFGQFFRAMGWNVMIRWSSGPGTPAKNQ
jgi:hypothetical protein